MRHDNHALRCAVGGNRLVRRLLAHDLADLYHFESQVAEQNRHAPRNVVVDQPRVQERLPGPVLCPDCGSDIRRLELRKLIVNPLG